MPGKAFNCIHICTYICIYIGTHTHIYIYKLCVCIYVYTSYVCILYFCMYINVHIYYIYRYVCAIFWVSITAETTRKASVPHNSSSTATGTTASWQQLACRLTTNRFHHSSLTQYPQISTVYHNESLWKIITSPCPLDSQLLVFMTAMGSKFHRNCKELSRFKPCSHESTDLSILTDHHLQSWSTEKIGINFKAHWKDGRKNSVSSRAVS